MTSERFYNTFTKEGLGDELDYFKWKALIDGIKEWERNSNGSKGIDRMITRYFEKLKSLIQSNKL